jgi:hypothetical protein
MTINRNNNTLLLLINTIVQQASTNKSYYSSSLIFLDPETLSLKGAKDLYHKKINEFGRSKLKKTDYFGGLPMEMTINNDNSIVITEEELVQEIIYRNGAPMHYLTKVGNTGLMILDENAEEKEGYEIDKKQIADRALLSPFHVADRRKGIYEVDKFRRNDIEYKSYLYAGSTNKNFIIINDNIDNFEKEDTEDKGIAKRGFTAVLYTIQNGNVEKNYLFGKPTDKYNTTSCFLQAADYQKKTNILATVMIERSARHDYEAKVAWIDFN